MRIFRVINCIYCPNSECRKDDRVVIDHTHCRAKGDRYIEDPENIPSWCPLPEEFEPEEEQKKLRRRGPEWWKALTAMERRELVELERARCHSTVNPSFPDPYRSCGWCKTPAVGGLCYACSDRVKTLQEKADQALGLEW